MFSTNNKLDVYLGVNTSELCTSSTQIVPALKILYTNDDDVSKIIDNLLSEFNLKFNCTITLDQIFYLEKTDIKKINTKNLSKENMFFINRFLDYIISNINISIKLSDGSQIEINGNMLKHESINLKIIGNRTQQYDLYNLSDKIITALLSVRNKVEDVYSEILISNYDFKYISSYIKGLTHAQQKELLYKILEKIENNHKFLKLKVDNPPEHLLVKRAIFQYIPNGNKTFLNTIIPSNIKQIMESSNTLRFTNETIDGLINLLKNNLQLLECLGINPDLYTKNNSKPGIIDEKPNYILNENKVDLECKTSFGIIKLKGNDFTESKIINIVSLLYSKNTELKGFIDNLIEKFNIKNNSSISLENILTSDLSGKDTKLLGEAFIFILSNLHIGIQINNNFLGIKYDNGNIDNPDIQYSGKKQGYIDTLNFGDLLINLINKYKLEIDYIQRIKGLNEENTKAILSSLYSLTKSKQREYLNKLIEKLKGINRFKQYYNRSDASFLALILIDVCKIDDYLTDRLKTNISTTIVSVRTGLTVQTFNYIYTLLCYYPEFFKIFEIDINKFMDNTIIEDKKNQSLLEQNNIDNQNSEESSQNSEESSQNSEESSQNSEELLGFNKDELFNRINSYSYKSYSVQKLLDIINSFIIQENKLSSKDDEKLIIEEHQIDENPILKTLHSKEENPVQELDSENSLKINIPNDLPQNQKEKYKFFYDKIYKLSIQEQKDLLLKIIELAKVDPEISHNIIKLINRGELKVRILRTIFKNSVSFKNENISVLSENLYEILDFDKEESKNVPTLSTENINCIVLHFLKYEFYEAVFDQKMFNILVKRFSPMPIDKQKENNLIKKGGNKRIKSEIIDEDGLGDDDTYLDTREFTIDGYGDTNEFVGKLVTADEIDDEEIHTNYHEDNLQDTSLLLPYDSFDDFLIFLNTVIKGLMTGKIKRAIKEGKKIPGLEYFQNLIKKGIKIKKEDFAIYEIRKSDFYGIIDGDIKIYSEPFSKLSLDLINSNRWQIINGIIDIESMNNMLNLYIEKYFNTQDLS